MLDISSFQTSSNSMSEGVSAPVIILGDFNLTPKEMEDHSHPIFD
jgi:endonuclease/exonuclease/phosphatase family metal-dependent hydrolase